MSLISTKEFLQCLDKHFPILDLGEHKRHHALMLENSKILLMLHVGEFWHNFSLDEEDFTKNPEDIVLKIKQLLKED